MENISGKLCPKCNEIKPCSSFAFRKTGSSLLKSHCKSCIANRARRAYHENPSISRASSKKWRDNNLSKARDCTKRWRDNNPEKRRAWELANPDKVKAMNKARRTSLKEYYRHYNRNYFLKNKEEVSEVYAARLIQKATGLKIALIRQHPLLIQSEIIRVRAIRLLNFVHHNSKSHGKSAPQNSEGNV